MYFIVWNVCKFKGISCGHVGSCRLATGSLFVLEQPLQSSGSHMKQVFGFFCLTLIFV